MADKSCDPPAEFYTVRLSQITFTVPQRYKRLECIGCGAHSAVAKAHDQKQKGRRVAIKKLARPFQDAEHARRTYRELHLLCCISHPNLINLLGAFSPQQQQQQQLQDVYLVMPHLECDLGTLLADRGRLKCGDALKITHAMLRGLRYLHSAGILHRDLKPANIALGRDGELKILDFGLARSCTDGSVGLTSYVCTRNYRSPEVLLCCGYGRPSDLWSAGCILAESVLGRPLFPALNVGHLLRDICRLVGKPEDNAAGWASTEASEFLAQLEEPSEQQQLELPQLFGHLRQQSRGRAACDLLRRLLTFDPALRISAQEALAHPALAKEQQQLLQQTTKKSPSSVAEPLDIDAAPGPIEWDFEASRDVAQWRAMVAEKLASMAPGSC